MQITGGTDHISSFFCANHILRGTFLSDVLPGFVADKGLAVYIERGLSQQDLRIPLPSHLFHIVKVCGVT